MIQKKLQQPVQPLQQKAPILTSPSLEDRIKGMLLLGAYGDAQARITEFQDIKTLHKQHPNSAAHSGYPTITPIANIKTDKPYARFTDDTHMSLFLAHALLQSDDQTIDQALNRMTDNLINWAHSDQTERAPGIAATKNSKIDNINYPNHDSLEKLQNKNATGMQLWSRGKLPSLDISESDQGLRKILYNNEGGSGAVMRTAPISILLRHDPEMAEKLAVAQGILTHTDSGSRAASAGFNATILAVLNGQSIDQVWQSAIDAAAKYDPRGYVESYNPTLHNYGQSHFSKNGCAAMCQQAFQYFKDGLKQKPYAEVLDEFRGWGATEALPASLYIYAM